MKIVKCIDNEIFAGTSHTFLTINRKYKVLDYNGTEELLLIENDNNTFCWYSIERFKDLTRQYKLKRILKK